MATTDRFQRNLTQSLEDMIVTGINRIANNTLRGLEMAASPSNQVQARQQVVENSLQPRSLIDTNEIPEIPDNELLQQAEAIATQKMTGEVPEDVQREVERITAEMASAGGVGPSQFASNITAQALGLTSLDIQNQGTDLAIRTAQGQLGYDTLRAQTALGVMDINARTQMFNEEMNLKWSALAEEGFQWDQKFELSQRELDLNARQIELRGLEIISNNQLGMNRILAELIISDSQAGIPNLQENIDSIVGGVEATNNYIMQYLGG